MLKIIILSVTFLSLGACKLESSLKTARATLNNANVDFAETISDEEGVKVAKFSADAQEPQVLSASETSNLGGASAAFPPGSFAVETEISLEEGVSILDDESTTQLGMTSEYTSSSRPLSISSSSDVSLVQPMALALEINESLQLNQEQEAVHYCVVYLVDTGSLVKMGVLESSKISVKGTLANFDFFTADKFVKISFQLAKVKIPIEKEAEIESKDPPKTLREKNQDDQKVALSAPESSVITDTTAPTSPAIKIARGASSTSLAKVDLSLSAGEASEMYVTNSSGCDAGGTWEAYSVSKSQWSLGQENSEATVYVKFRDLAGNQTACVSDVIIHDNMGPAEISLNFSGEDYSNRPETLLSTVATGATSMYVSEIQGCASGATWLDYAKSINWTLSATNAKNTVYAKFRDAAGNESACIEKSIVHDSIAPQAPNSVDHKKTTSVGSSSPLISWGSATDSGSGIARYEISIGSSASSSDIKGWTDIGLVSSKKVDNLNLAWGAEYFSRLKAIDKAGNESSVVSGNSFLYGYLQNAFLKASNHAAQDWFGRALAISGDTIVVGAPHESAIETHVRNGSGPISQGSGAAESGAVYVFKRNGELWVQEAYIKAGSVGANDNFGYSVAISGDTIVVGAYGEDASANSIINGVSAVANDGQIQSGAAYVYSRDINGQWVHRAYLKASNSDEDDLFGRSVAISGDVIVVGAEGEDSSQTAVFNGSAPSFDEGLSNSGAAYVFRKVGSNWLQDAYLKASNADSDDEFGRSVAISGDLIVVGARYEDSNQATSTTGSTGSSDNTKVNSGAAYIYRYTSSSWSQEAYLKPSNLGENDFFGYAVAVENDVVVIGAYQEDSDQKTISQFINTEATDSAQNSGAAYVFKYTNNQWSQEAYLKSDNSDAGDRFGFSVGISQGTIVVGAYGEASAQSTVVNGGSSSANNTLSDAGAAYVFNRAANGHWEQKSYLKANNVGDTDAFGRDVAISGDHIIVASYFEDSQISNNNGTELGDNDSAPDSGAIYIFSK